MVEKWPFLKLEFNFFFLPKLKNTVVKSICDNVVVFDPIEIQTHLAPQNDHQHLNFVKDVYAIGKKRPEMVVNWPNAKVVSFFNGQSLF